MPGSLPSSCDQPGDRPDRLRVHGSTSRRVPDASRSRLGSSQPRQVHARAAGPGRSPSCRSPRRPAARALLERLVDGGARSGLRASRGRSSLHGLVAERAGQHFHLAVDLDLDHAAAGVALGGDLAEPLLEASPSPPGSWAGCRIRPASWPISLNMAHASSASASASLGRGRRSQRRSPRPRWTTCAPSTSTARLTSGVLHRPRRAGVASAASASGVARPAAVDGGRASRRPTRPGPSRAGRSACAAPPRLGRRGPAPDSAHV